MKCRYFESWHRRTLAVAVSMAASLVATGAVAAPVDLSTWTAESYQSVAGFGDGVWTVSADGSSVHQSVNGQPTLFYSDFNAHGISATGSISVSGGDDDFIGFVLGFQPGDSTNALADYLLVDWKRGSQAFNFSGGTSSNTPGTTAFAGLAVSRVSGIPTADEFWGHTSFGEIADTGGLTELQRASSLGATGWNIGQNYLFSFDFGPNNLNVYVDGVLELSIAGVFNDGRFGFYNFSQAGVTYAAFTVDSGSFPATIPLPASLPLLLGAAGLLAMVRRRA